MSEVPTNQLTGEPVTNQELEQLVSLVESMIVRGQQIEKLEDELKSLKKEHSALEQQRIPDMMDELGLSSFELRDGTKIVVSDFYSASIPDDKKPFAFQWLDDHGFGGIVKDEFSLKFAKSEHEVADDTAIILEDHGIPYSRKMSVHPQTLKSFVRERYEAGEVLPPEGFKVFIGKKTKIKKQ